MRFSTIRTAALCTMVVAGGAAMNGCANKTEGERTLERAAEIEEAGTMITRGEQMERDGKAIEARGRTAREQGDTTEGNRLMNEGQAKVKQGQALIEQGRRAKR